MKTLAMTFSLLLAATVSQAATLNVPFPYASIQSAVNAAGPYDTVEIAPGVYYEKVDIQSKSHLTIRPSGYGAVVIDAGGSGIPLGIGGGIIDDLFIKDLTLRNTSDNVGLWIGYCSRVTVQGCRVENVSGHGIHVEWASNVVVKKCLITSPGQRGINVVSAGTRLVKNTVITPASDGIRVVMNACAVERNVVKGAKGDGIVVGNGVDSTNSCLIHRNELTDVVGDAIYFTTAANNCTITENKIKRAGLDGIEVTYLSGGHTIYKNNINKVGFQGIQVESDTNTVRRNKVKRAGSDGVWVGTFASSNLFHKNRVSKSQGDGFEIWGTGNTFLQNKATGSAVYDLNDNAGPAANTYSSNTFSVVKP